MNELRHHGHAMRWSPVNLRADSLVEQLRAGRQVFVQLEPGDATHYDLLVAWLPALANAFNLDPDDAKDGLLVIRLVGGHVIGTALAGWFNHGWVAAIANGNEWSAELLDWWCNELIDRLSPQPKAAGASA